MYLTSINIPKEDFIDAQYDRECNVQLKEILLILSTPRSGSTFLSDLIYKNQLCIPHEYFQIPQYMPILATRWGCIEDNILNKEAFMKALIQHRCSEKGCLGINLHGSHLKTFEQFLKLLPKVKFSVVHIMRKDTIAQAVSYYIASVTKKWSSHFSSQGDVEYNYYDILACKERIDIQNQQIVQFVGDNNLSYIPCYYEDIVKNPAPLLSEIVGKPVRELVLCSGLVRQASQQNVTFIKQFKREYWWKNNELLRILFKLFNHK